MKYLALVLFTFCGCAHSTDNSVSRKIAANEASITCNANEAQSTIKAAMQKNQMQVNQIIHSLGNNFKDLMGDSEASRKYRVSKNPRLLTEDLKLSSCIIQYMDVSEASIQTKIRRYNELFDAEVRSIEYQQPLIANEKNGLALERENLDILKNNRNIVSAIRALGLFLKDK